MEEAGEAAGGAHAAESGEGFLELGREDGALFDGSEEARSGLAVSEASAAAVQLRAIAVAPFGTGEDLDGRRRLELANTLEGFAEDGFLLSELLGVGDVLVVASATDAEVGARRVDAVGGGIGDAFGACAKQLG